MSTEITAYLSHCIRANKENPSIKEMLFNNNKAIILANELRKTFPFLDVYVPAENNEFDLAISKGKYLTTDQILEIDCKILEKRDLLLVYDWQVNLSAGQKVEVFHAGKIGIPMITFSCLSEAIEKIREFLGIS